MEYKEKSNCIKDTIYIDDGYSGVHFERPGMQEMLNMVKAGKIDCILVKDFSRFARDYIVLGSFLERFFPFWGVRFISVNDHYDSQNYQGSAMGIDMNFKNLLSDFYSKDLSKKVRSSLAARKESGEYVSANSPFGYEKDPHDTHALVIAQDEAKVVRQIFSLTLEGYTSVEIAKQFNESGVKTPLAFKVEKGKTGRLPKGGNFLWSSSMVCQILHNEVYVGNLVQKKYTKDMAGGKIRVNPRGEWLVSYHQHQPIITNEVFDIVQKKLGKKKAVSSRPRHPLVGRLICGCCKKNLSYRTGRHPYYTCTQRFTNPAGHCIKKVDVRCLEQAILLMMHERQQIQKELGKQTALAQKAYEKKKKQLTTRRRFLQAGIQNIRQQNFASYQNYAFERSSYANTHQSYAFERSNSYANTHQSYAFERSSFTNTQKKEKTAAAELEALEKSMQEVEDRLQTVQEQSKLCTLHKELVEQFIDKIIVSEIQPSKKQMIEIYWSRPSSACLWQASMLK